MTVLHWVDFWHDWAHAARLSSTPGELSKYPLFAASHALPEILTEFAGSLAAGVVGLFADWRNVTEVAPLSVTKLSHIVLKWLHHPEAKNVTLLHAAES